MEMACTTARNHTELLLKITDMFSNSVELCQDLNKTQTEAIMSRFKTEIITRQERILSKLISLTEKWITDRVSSLQLDTKKAINLAGSYSMMKSTLSNLSIADEFFMTTCSNLITR